MNTAKGSTDRATQNYERFIHADRPNSPLNGRFELVGELGTGRRSSVWLANDLHSRQSRLARLSLRLIAIKILSARDTQAQSVICDELDIIKHVRRKLTARGVLHPAHKHFPAFFGAFNIADNDGVHLCLTMEPLVSFWQGIQGDFNAISVFLGKDVTRQLLEGIRFLHEDCSVIHRDINTDNLLVSIGPTATNLSGHKSISRRTSSQRLPSPTAVLSGTTTAIFCARPGPFKVKQYSEELSYNIKLAGFGSAVINGSLPSVEPVVYCSTMTAPETVMGNKPDFGTDIWSLGCLTYQLITGRPVFVMKHTGHHLQLMQAIAEQDFDIAYIRQGRHFTKYFDPRTNCPYHQADDPPNIYEQLNSHSWIAWEHPDDRGDFVDFFLKMMHLHPLSREPAAKLLEHRWLQSQISRDT